MLRRRTRGRVSMRFVQHGAGGLDMYGVSENIGGAISEQVAARYHGSCSEDMRHFVG